MRAVSVLAIAAIAAVVSAGVEDVLILGKANFTDTISGDATVLVKFYAPWCGHCKSMKEDYEAAAEVLKGKAILAEVDATIETEIAEQYEVQGYPTLKLFQGGEAVMDYSGGRDKDSMISFVESSLMPAVSEMDAAALTTAIADAKSLYVFVLPDAGDKFKKFEAVAKKARADLAGKATFASATAEAAKDLIAKSAATEGQVIMKTHGEGDDAVYSTLEIDEEFEKKALLGAVPIFGELSRETAQLYIQHPCCIIFADPNSEEHKKYKEVMTETSKKFLGNGKLLFAWIDTTVLGSFREQIGVTAEPGVAIIEFEGPVKYIFEPKEGVDFTPDVLKPWVESYLEGSLSPNLKSAPVPESNDEPVKIVVGDSWEDMVMDSEKDVLIEQYAPWCGHCKKLEPIYNELAEKLSGVESIRIAKMDATENDAPSPHAARGYPTITFFPAGKKDEGIPYNGGRTVDEMVTFLKQHASHKFEIGEAAAPEAADAEKSEL